MEGSSSPPEIFLPTSLRAAVGGEEIKGNCGFSGLLRQDDVPPRNDETWQVSLTLEILSAVEGEALFLSFLAVEGSIKPGKTK